MKSILTNSRREDVASFARQLGRKANEAGRDETSAFSSAVPDSIKNVIVSNEANKEEQEDEILLLPDDASRSDAAVWMVKLPEYVFRRWSAVDEEGRQLGTIRIWDMKNPKTGMPYVTIYTPSEEDPNVMEKFETVVQDAAMGNSYLFATQTEDANNNDVDGTEPRAGYKVFAGKVTTKISAQPTFDDAYRKRMQERYETARARHVKKMEYSDVVGIQSESRESKDAMSPGDPKDKFTRLARAELFHALFAAFDQQKIWGLKELHVHTRQPMQYLKEQLPHIAERVPHGKKEGKWMLRSDYKKFWDTISLEASEIATGSGHNAAGSNDDMEIYQE